MKCALIALILICATFSAGFPYDYDKDAIQSAKQSSSIGKPPATASSPPKPESPVTESHGNSSPPATKVEKPAEEVDPLQQFLANKFFVPTAAIIVVLFLAVLWLLYDRRKSAPINPVAVTNDNPPSPAPVPAPVVVDKPAETPVFRVGNLHNIGRRKEQQDSFCLSDIRDIRALREKGLLAVVADGMGGLEGGAAISQLVTDIFRRNYNASDNFRPETFLYESARMTEKAVEDYMNRTGTDGGSTLVAVLIRGNALNFISVGDSHIYILRDGSLTQLNHEHTYGALLQEKAKRGEVDPNEPFVNPKRKALVAYIGVGNLNLVDRNSREIFLKSGDKVLLCSDGVFNALSDEAIIAALGGDAMNAAISLENAILARALPKQDNFTGVILEYVG